MHTSTLDEIMGTLGTPWADLSVSDSQPDYDSFVVFPEEDSDLATEEGDGCEIRRVSKKTAAFLAEAFAKTVPNGTRRKLRQTFGMPQTESTRCPKLDPTVKAQWPKHCKDGDRPLARIQTLTLDAIGPLTALVEEAAKGTLSTKAAAADAATTALRFLGNASANISHERRRRAYG